MADKGKRRKGKQRADKRGFSPSKGATIVFQGRQAGRIAPLHSQDRLVFLLHKTARTLRFPAFLVTFDTKSNAKRSVANQGTDNPSV